MKEENKVITVLEDIQREMWEGVSECTNCGASCCVCERYNALEKIKNFIKSIDK